MTTALHPRRPLPAAIATFLFLSSVGSGGALAQEAQLGGSLAVGSDYTFRGVSQTLGSAALQASVDLALPSGLYAGAFASNVDFVPDDEPDDGARVEIDATLGFATDLGDAWTVDVYVTRYLFPGAAADVDYDYTELLATAVFDGRFSATVGLSGDVDGSGPASRYYGLAADFGLPADVTLAVDVGHVDVERAYGRAYSYVEATLSRRFENAAVALTFVDTGSAAQEIYGRAATGERLVVTLSVDW